MTEEQVTLDQLVLLRAELVILKSKIDYLEARINTLLAPEISEDVKSEIKKFWTNRVSEF
jgi:hypothetical protein